MKLSLSMSGWMKKLLAVVALGAVFGTIGYLISPKAARASISRDENLTQAGKQLKEAQAGRKTLEKQAKDLQDQLTAARQQADVAAGVIQADEEEIALAENTIADLDLELDRASHADEPVRQRLDAAEKAAAESRAAAESASSRADLLAAETAQLKKDRQALDEMRQQLMANKSHLEKDLAGQTRTRAEMERLLEALSFGQGQAPPSPPAVTGEMPITMRELIWRVGQPSLVFQQRNGQVDMQWGKEHSARAVQNIVLWWDGQVASRSAVQAMANTPLAAPPVPWHYRSADPLSYADLVWMFGQPDGLSGTGKDFTAWWAVGAWARPATATVTDGVVRQFDGRPVNAAALCELVRHRPAAYAPGNEAADVVGRISRIYYQEASKVVEQNLSKEAASLAKDGLKLTCWRLAPLDSVGTWVGPTGVPADAITVRAWLDTTYVATDRTSTTQRRYVIVTFSGAGGGVEVADYAVFAPRS